MQESHRLDTIFASPIGHLGIKTNTHSLVGIEFLSAQISLSHPASALATEVSRQLQAYFEGKSVKFDLPIALHVSPFQHSVLDHLCAVPFGETVTYGMLAKQLDTSARAVGNACRRNPLPIIIPCHRVVAQQGMGGFAGAVAGDFLAMKHWLLQHEQSIH